MAFFRSLAGLSTSRSALSPIGAYLYRRMGGKVLTRYPPNLLEYFHPTKCCGPVLAQLKRLDPRALTVCLAAANDRAGQTKLEELAKPCPLVEQRLPVQSQTHCMFARILAVNNR